MTQRPRIQPRFPGGKAKALVMSYDDGSEHDRRLVDIFNRHGIRGTFHLNSGKLGREGHVASGEVASLYRDHEVSCHTVTHPCLTDLDNESITREVGDDRRTLETLSGRQVRGLAYPFGAYDERVSGLLPGLGIEYARTIDVLEDFQVPENFLHLGTTCHHNVAMERSDRFLATGDEDWRLMFVWGHSYELDGFMSCEPHKNWDYMESFCRRMQDCDDLSCLTIMEMVDYVRAARSVRCTGRDDGIENPGRCTVWLRVGDADLMLAPGERVEPSG
jgi:peptidoglycan-N-acetylglucosamine deacetylase